MRFGAAGHLLILLEAMLRAIEIGLGGLHTGQRFLFSGLSGLRSWLNGVDASVIGT